MRRQLFPTGNESILIFAIVVVLAELVVGFFSGMIIGRGLLHWGHYEIADILDPVAFSGRISSVQNYSDANW